MGKILLLWNEALVTLYMVNEFFLYITDEAAREEMSIGIFALRIFSLCCLTIGGMIADKYIGLKIYNVGRDTNEARSFFMAFYFDVKILQMGYLDFQYMM